MKAVRPFILAALVIATAPLQAQSEDISVIGKYGDWSIRKSESGCSIGMETGTRAVMFYASRRSPSGDPFRFMLLDPAINAVTPTQSGVQISVDGKPLSNAEIVRPGRNPPMNIATASFPDGALAGLSRPGREISYVVTLKGTALTEGKVSVPADGLAALRTCLGA